jgi:hypothetical protein
VVDDVLDHAVDVFARPRLGMRAEDAPHLRAINQYVDDTHVIAALPHSRWDADCVQRAEGDENVPVGRRVPVDAEQKGRLPRLAEVNNEGGADG